LEVPVHTGLEEIQRWAMRVWQQYMALVQLVVPKEQKHTLEGRFTHGGAML